MQRLINEIRFLLGFTWLSFLFFDLNKGGGFSGCVGFFWFFFFYSRTYYSINKA